MQLVEFVSSDHQLVFGDLQLTGTLARDPVPLPAGLAAKVTRASGPCLRSQDPSTPTATGVVIEEFPLPSLSAT